MKHAGALHLRRCHAALWAGENKEQVLRNASTSKPVNFRVLEIVNRFSSVLFYSSWGDAQYSGWKLTFHAETRSNIQIIYQVFRRPGK
jgi:hypothetical protein